MIARALPTLASVVLAATLVACGSAPREERRPVADAPIAAPVYGEYGRVRDIELVSTGSGHTSGGGAVLGAVLGAVVGNQIGSGTGRVAATGVGAVAGGVVGNQIERRNRRDDEVYRVSVRFDNGSVQSYDFQRIDDLRVGDRVKWEGGQLHRV
ncbi:glycine zipper 2TM domain-containing protein [Rhizobacter sp. SG703]|uniref:glycine zipper 2TM domain-containing protein n=1 Tax=Rhizobacter sp. SG703 TaxID=2587140 RepID=UPI0014478430|nr:glycine zipper 2TM domain-containing protein [Rhizobacter sp. SG703]NKI94082.1 outer membrane lipoprotein SlyB [Rhizobacter sp. SG703]